MRDADPLQMRIHVHFWNLTVSGGEKSPQTTCQKRRTSARKTRNCLFWNGLWIEAILGQDWSDSPCLPVIGNAC